MLQRSLRRDDRLSSDVDPAPVDGIRFAVVPTSREFDVLFVDRTGGPLLVAVMLRVCNASGRPRTPTDDLVLVDAFGSRLQPVDLPAGNELAYRPASSPRAGLPRGGSAADATLGGGAVVFRVPLDVRRNPPLALEITSASGARQRIAVDL
jgi:hypothetical protein